MDDLSPATDEYLTFAAAIAGITKAQVIERLVLEKIRTATEVALDSEPDAALPVISIHADYAGHRTRAEYRSSPVRIDIVDGPLAGQKFGSPSQAARAVIKHFKPEVNSNRNGWDFWVITATGNSLQTIRNRSR
jgi:hypothetical protein